MVVLRCMDAEQGSMASQRKKALVQGLPAGAVGGCVALSTLTPLYSPQPTLQKQKPRYRADGPWGR